MILCIPYQNDAFFLMKLFFCGENQHMCKNRLRSCNSCVNILFVYMC